MGNWRCLASAVGPLLVLTWSVSIQGSERPEIEEEAVFEMREISLLDGTAPLDSYLLRGQHLFCRAEPYAEVKKYPVLHSKHPWYGQVVFHPDRRNPNSRMVFYFVVDESGNQPKPQQE